MLEDGKITGNIAKTVLQESFRTGKSPETIVSERNLVQIENEEIINSIIKETVAENSRAVQDYRNGKEQAVSYLIGQIMRKTKGQANPALLRKNLLDYLNKL